jgi:hypothetical protein
MINEFKAAYSKDPKNASIEPLKAEFAKIISSCSKIGEMKNSGCESDSLFYEDLRPWLLKVKNMSQSAIVMLDALAASDLSKVNTIEFAKTWSAIEGVDKNSEHRFDILRGMGSDITLSVQTAEPAAQALRPFLDWLLKEIENKNR